MTLPRDYYKKVQEWANNLWKVVYSPGDPKQWTEEDEECL
jgi:hypothetical protein